MTRACRVHVAERLAKSCEVNETSGGNRVHDGCRRAERVSTQIARHPPTSLSCTHLEELFGPVAERHFGVRLWSEVGNTANESQLIVHARPQRCRLMSHDAVPSEMVESYLRGDIERPRSVVHDCGQLAERLRSCVAGSITRRCSHAPSAWCGLRMTRPHVNARTPARTLAYPGIATPSGHASTTISATTSRRCGSIAAWCTPARTSARLNDMDAAQTGIDLILSSWPRCPPDGLAQHRMLAGCTRWYAGQEHYGVLAHDLVTLATQQVALAQQRIAQAGT